MFPAGMGLDNCSGQVYGWEVRSACCLSAPLEVGLQMGWDRGRGTCLGEKWCVIHLQSHGIVGITERLGLEGPLNPI